VFQQTMISDDAVHKQLLREVTVMHQRLHGVPPLTAELQFILDAQELDGYGREYYPVKVTTVDGILRWRQWCSGRALDLQSLGCGFDSHWGQGCVATLGKLFTRMLR